MDKEKYPKYYYKYQRYTGDSIKKNKERLKKKSMVTRIYKPPNNRQSSLCGFCGKDLRLKGIYWIQRGHKVYCKKHDPEIFKDKQII